MTDNTPALPANYTVHYTKPVIEIDNYDQLKQAVDDYTAKFEGMVVTEKTVKAAKDSRATLNALATALNKRRIEINKDYSQPYKDFKAKVDELIAKINATNAPIDAAVKQLAQEKRDKRSGLLDDLISEMLPKHNLTAEDMDEVPETWLNEDMWTDKNNPRLKLTKAVGEHLDGINNRKARIAADRTAAKAYAENNNLEPDSWLALLDEGKTFAEVRPLMDNALAKREHDRKQAEARKAYEDAIARLNQEQHGEKRVDKDTGEVIDSFAGAPGQFDDQVPLPEEPAPQPNGTMIEFLGTDDQLKVLTDFMNISGYQYIVH